MASDVLKDFFGSRTPPQFSDHGLKVVMHVHVHCIHTTEFLFVCFVDVMELAVMCQGILHNNFIFELGLIYVGNKH